VLGAAVLALVGSNSMVKNLGSIFLPQVDDGNVSVMIRLPAGAAAVQTNQIALEIEEMIRDMPHVETVFTTAGGFLWGASTSQRSGRGSLSIRLADRATRDMTADEWVQRLQAKIEERGFAGARVFVRPPRIRGL